MFQRFVETNSRVYICGILQELDDLFNMPLQWIMFSHIDLIRSGRTHVSHVGRPSPKAGIGQFPLGSSSWLRG